MHIKITRTPAVLTIQVLELSKDCEVNHDVVWEQKLPLDIFTDNEEEVCISIGNIGKSIAIESKNNGTPTKDGTIQQFYLKSV